MRNLFIPKNKAKTNFKKFDINQIINFEKRIFENFNNGLIRFPIHLAKGNEIYLKKIFEYISPKDWVLCQWRNHAHALLHGIPEENLYSQIMNGKSMYVSSKKHNFLSSSIAGGTIPIALGISLAIKRRKQKNKVWCFLGDMTSKMGVFYEAYNYSRNFNLPLEFVIEDNEKSVYTDTKKCWGIKKEVKIPKDVFYYKYKLEYPHHGTGTFVEFQ